MVPDDRDTVDFGAAVVVGCQEILCVLREFADVKAGRHVPQREHRVGFAAAEVGLQVDHRGSVVIAGESAHRPPDQVAQTFGQVGAFEEFDGIGVAGVLFAAEGHLVKVGGELGGGEVSGGDVFVWRQNLAPGFEPGGFRVVDSGLEDLLVVFVGGDAAKVEPDARGPRRPPSPRR